MSYFVPEWNMHFLIRIVCSWMISLDVSYRALLPLSIPFSTVIRYILAHRNSMSKSCLCHIRRSVLQRERQSVKRLTSQLSKRFDKLKNNNRRLKKKLKRKKGVSSFASQMLQSYKKEVAKWRLSKCECGEWVGGRAQPPTLVVNFYEIVNVCKTLRKTSRIYFRCYYSPNNDV